MTKVIAVRPFRGNEGFVTVGQEIEVTPQRARDLVRRRLVQADIGAEEVHAGEGGTDPSEQPQTGGQTGEAEQSSLSEEDPQPAKRGTRSTGSRGRGKRKAKST